jgi:hypothetical protein
MQIKSKTQQMLEAAYQRILEGNTDDNIPEGNISEDEANKLSTGFNMLPQQNKEEALQKLQGLVGRKVTLFRAGKLKQSTGYGRDEAKPNPGDGGSVAHTVTSTEDEPYASGIIQDVKTSSGNEDYTLNGNLVVSIDDKDYNLNQGLSTRIRYNDSLPHPRPHSSGVTITQPLANRFKGMH